MTSLVVGELEKSIDACLPKKHSPTSPLCREKNWRLHISILMPKQMMLAW
jgi:hypothetical protein